MIRLDDIILLLIQTVGDDDLIGILLRIDGILLKSDIHLAEVHRRRIGTQLLPEGELVWVFHGTDLLSLKIREILHRLVAGHDAEPLICVSEKLKSRFSVRLLYQLHKVSVVHGLSHGVDILKHAWHVEYRRIIDKVYLRRRILHNEGDIPVITAL